MLKKYHQKKIAGPEKMPRLKKSEIIHRRKSQIPDRGFSVDPKSPILIPGISPFRVFF